jgi:predicted transcriptional regulator of viral defense system
VTSLNEKRLFETASGQCGLFTARQALAAGFAENTHPYHVKKGNWIRALRGVYRLALFGDTRSGELMKFLLWSRDRRELPQGTFSHITALELHGLVEPRPGCHLTVPRAFRRSAQPPAGLHLYRCDLRPEGVTRVKDFPTTIVSQALLESIEDKVLAVSEATELAGAALEREYISLEIARSITDRNQMPLVFEKS